MEIIYSLSEIQQVADKIIPLLTSKVVVFQANMGMGKTTFIKALAKSLGVNEPITSPTFGLVNSYENQENTIYHFDFYRIKDQQEAFDIGFEEYLYSDNWCFIEWAERVKRYLPDSYMLIEISHINELTRKLKISAVDL